MKAAAAVWISSQLILKSSLTVIHQWGHSPKLNILDVFVLLIHIWLVSVCLSNLEHSDGRPEQGVKVFSVR